MVAMEDSIGTKDANTSSPCEEKTSGGGCLSNTLNDTDNSNLSGESCDKTPPRKTRLLIDLYNSCTFALHVVDL